ncbi:beta-ketoacyl synthase N-terminal-like domain-containing protein [Janthinobacterium fluminis]|uniref:Beta-ketoacyl synthase N-terminal-like domain-containing protein n=1 Tax=Janthinobacterium fluminis TaxID=2987524 RepID=A0ABT5K2T9_9BURK|nr:beta-ketoacyl synthase N-terminal-like domain-containing protein [Janthinobacterium fluminis]MDC8758067.1 beta-ketoacyl synthase N-terminal-like domain-containing protein [Janthinobacterium fluminis]
MEKIAIIGLGCLFPGAETPEQYWRNLLERQDSSSELSSAELDADPALYHHPQAGTADKIGYSKNGHVRGFAFDAEGYRLPAAQLRQLDPLFQWTLYAAEQALKDSRYADKAPALARCGLIIGNIGMPTHAGKKLMNGFYQQALEPYLQTLTGRPDFHFHSDWKADGLSELNLKTVSHNATIAAQALGLGGPCFALDAACASALYAIQMASYYLQSGKADLMLAGAVCRADHIYIDHGFNVLQAFPSHGASTPFDRDSQGLKAGEGSSLIALKRHADAVRDGDQIYGVIESIGLSNDGGAKHILVPDVNGQLLSLQRAYAGIERGIDYLECHATGTPVGDQVELASVEAFFGGCARRPLIGANKGNIGHMLTASGMASTLKVLLAMRHGVIPPTLNVQNMVATPKGELNLGHIVREATPWPQQGALKRAGINAFGFGGVNGHMVLREHVAQAAPPRAAAPAPLASLAIIGSAVLMADTEANEGFDDTILQGRSVLGALPHTRWLGLEGRADILQTRGLSQAPLGAYIEKFEFDCKRFRLPPKVVGTHLLAHLSLMPTAERAFHDAGYVIDGHKRNIAVIVAGDIDYSCLRYQARNEMAWQVRDSLARCGIELSPEQVDALERIAKDSLFPAPYPEGITGGIGNVVASRIAAHLKLDGPAFFLGSHENAAFKAIELAQFMLSNQLVEAVIVAGGSFAGGIENVLWGERDANGAALPAGDGAGVILLKREQDARAANERIYAVMRGLAIVHECGDDTRYRPAAGAVARAAAAALAQAGAAAGAVDYIELGGGQAAERGVELDGLAQAYAGRSAPLGVGSVSANYGNLAAAQGILGIIKTAHCLYRRALPAGAGVAGSPEGAARPAFQPAAASLAWPAPAAGLRLAAVNSLGIDRAYAHMLLQEPDEDNRRTARAPAAAAAATGSLMTTVYTGREQTIPEMILNPANCALFGTTYVPAAAPAAAAAPSGVAAQLDGEHPVERACLRNAQTQLRYLQAEQHFYQRMAAMMEGQWLAVEPLRAAAAPVPAPRRLVFDEAQLVELTNGSVAKVLGPDYAEADTYPIRTRMPSPPYMFASRVTAMSAQKGKLEPCFIEWECDLPVDAWYVNNGMVPAFVALESSHAMIVAFTYIGCDQLFKGQLRYRAVDSQTTVYGAMPKAGEVLRGRVNIKSFLRVGRNVLIAYEFLCYVGTRLAFKLEANSGFFLPKDIEKSKGVNTAPYLKTDGPAAPFTPPLRCERGAFDDAAIDALLRGDLARCFGPAYHTPHAAPLCAPAAKMLHRVLSVTADGGAFGLGEVLGECDIDPAHWVFKAHFMNDPVMPGTFLVEGCEQMVKFYLCYLGLYTQPQLTPHVLSDHHYSAKFRGEVKCEAETLRYRLTCKAIERSYGADGALERVALVFLAEIIYRGNVIGICDNLGAGFSTLALPNGAPQAAPQPVTEAST